MGGSGGDAAAGSPSSTGNGGGKRGRDPEDEVYLDNLHSSKRYLSEVLFFLLAMDNFFLYSCT